MILTSSRLIGRLRLGRQMESTRVPIPKVRPHITFHVVWTTQWGVNSILRSSHSQLRLCWIRDDGRIYGARGSVYRTLGKVDLALLDLTVALTGNADIAHHYLERSYVYEEIGNLEAAIADLSKAMEFSPQDYNIPSFEGRLARLKETLTHSQPKAQPSTFPRTKWDRNVQKYTEAINLNPRRSSNYKFRGNAYLKKGEFGLALTDFDKAVELNPSSPSNYEHRSKAYAHLGELDLAEEDISTAKRLRTQRESVSSTGNSLRPDANEIEHSCVSRHSGSTSQTIPPAYGTKHIASARLI